ncbi:hypothetical protein V8F06_014612 [Rhypophila decipiens]
MDPITALGIVSGVVALVDFAAKLIKASGDISADGACLDVQMLEEEYSRMSGLVESVQSTPLPPTGTRDLVEASLAASLRELCESSRSDCQELLGLLDQLRVKPGKQNSWRTISAAFRTLLGKKKIAAMENRLQRTRKLVLSYQSAIVSQQVSDMRGSVQELFLQTTQLEMKSDNALEQLSKCLRTLESLSTRARPDSPPSPLLHGNYGIFVHVCVRCLLAFFCY